MRHILIAATSAIAISALSAAPAIAQQKPADEPATATADDIVVTARRVSERQQDVPVAVTALQSAQIQRLGVQSPIDLRQAVVGLGVTSSAGRMSTPVYAIRGQRAGDTVMTQDAPVAIYQDEVLISPPAGGNLGLFDLENVQVLKGPQGTLFGRNTTGGAVLFTSARPTDRLEGQVKLGYGNNQAWEGLAVLNVPLSDSLSVRGAVTYNKNNGFGTYYAGPATGQHTDDRDEIAARLSIAFEPTPWLKTLTIGAYAKHIDHGTPFVLLGTPRPFGAADFVFNNPLNLPNLFPQGTLAAAQAAQRQHSPYDGATGLINPGNRYEVYSVTNTTTIELSDTLTFKNIFGYRKLKYTERNDYDGTVLPIIDAVNGTHAENFTEEAQFQGKAFDNKLDYIAGVYFLHQSGDDGSGPNNGGLGIPGQMATLQFAQAPAYQVGTLRNISFSGFGQVNYKVTDTLKATAGIRYTMDRRSIDVGSGTLDAAGNLTACNFTDSLGNPLPATFAACRQTNQRTFTSPSWQLGLDWKVDPATLVYITSRHSFRSGGFVLRGASNSAIAAYFAPESVTDVELGLKRDWELGADLRLRTNLAGYYQWYKNIQRNISVRNASGQIGNQTVNAAKAHIYGLEAELGLRAGSLLDVAFNYALTKPKYDDYPTTAPVLGVPAQPDNYKDYGFQYVPTHQINASVTLTPDVGELGKLSLSASLYYQSRVFLSEDYQSAAQLAHRIAPGSVIPADAVYSANGYALVNGRFELAGIMGTGFTAGIWAKNLFDKRYLDNGVLFQDSAGAAVGVYGAPRTFGADISYKF